MGFAYAAQSVRYHRMLVLFFLLMFIVGTDTFLVAPLLPVLRSTFNVSTANAGWLVSAYALGYASVALVIGPLSDGWDRKRVLLIGMVSFAAATFLCGVAGGFWWMIGFRFLAGAAAAIASPQVWAAIATLLPPAQVVRGMGIATAGLAVSQALGVPIGSCLSTLGWRVPFYAVSMAAMVVAALISWVIPSMQTQPNYPSRSRPKSSLLKPYRTLLSSRTACLVFLAYFLLQAANFGRFSYIGIWLADRFHAPEVVVGLLMLWFGVGNLLGSLFGGRAVQQFGQGKVLIGALFILTVVALTIPVCTTLFPIRLLWGLTALCFGTVFPVMMAMMQSIAPNLRGTTSSLANALMYGGSTVGTWSAGWLYMHAGGFVSVSLQTAGGLLLAAVLFSLSGVLPLKNVRLGGIRGKQSIYKQ
ncbi:MFS transporter [Alicyclobacillus dauci]|uniref:MFS transporter n=1 Tax=Alicyclobacillus dauci TaxID=1475485 RepID=A0ABY6Z1Z8_9BACL|nr:MFS transporter [Alicyclobacillus dauci]WAH36927.1 MFS transporter [Alicyclobacillus dauci]